MKHSVLLTVCLSFLLILAACSHAPAVATEPPATIPVSTEAPTEPATQPPTEAPTEAPHSNLFIPGLPVEDVILYFNEVCLDAEYINSGDPSVLQKWIAPISYHVHGIPTEDDLETLRRFAQWLNAIEGFPGMTQTDDPDFANLQIHFCTEQDLLDLMGDHLSGTDGAVTFWYMDDIIYEAIICCRTDLDQYLRNSVILEEIYNGLGPVQDTDLRPESIIYSGFSQPQELTEIDELILELLYHPDMKCGMTAVECEAVIRKLYY